MNSKKVICILMIIIGISMLLLQLLSINIINTGKSAEHPADSMWIEPSTIELNTDSHAIGYKFNVTIFINLTETSTAWQFMLIYNKNYLDATRCGYTAGSKSEFFNGLTTIPVSPSFGPYNSTHNYVLHAETILLEPFRGPGSGSLAWIEFEVIAAPEPGETIETTLSISTEVPEETYALDENDEKIILTAYDAVYTFASTAPPPPPPPPPPVGTAIFVDPEELIDPTMVPGSTFSINITLMNITNLKTCQFNMSYDTTVISWLSVIVFKINDQMPVPSAIINDEAGSIWVQLKYSTPITITGTHPLIKIDFIVDAYGCTNLDLHDTALINDQGEPIDHEVRDGYFCTLIRDLAILGIETSRSWVYEGWNLDINVTLKNEGNISETFNVIVFSDDIEIGNITVENLPPGAQVTITVNWNTTSFLPCRNYTIRSEIPPVTYELDLADNSYIDGKVKVRILGDINGDNSVDISDIRWIAMAFGSYPNHPRWNPDADLDQNQKVNIMDVRLACINFGKTC